MKQPQKAVQSQFTNRTVELEIVARRVEILQKGGGVFQCVLNFYGIPGVGKTALLSELDRLAASGHWPGHRLQPVLSALTDLATVVSPDQLHRAGPEALASQMKQLDDQTQIASMAFYDALNDFHRQRITDLDDEEAWYRARQAAKRVADSFTSFVYDQGKKLNQPVLLMFDNSDRLPPDAFDWLEFEVFSPLVQSDRVLLVLTGCSPIRWKRFEVRRRVYLGKLHPPEQGAELVRQQAPSWSKVADNIVQLTFGLPTANRTVVEALGEITAPVDGNNFDQYRPQLLKRLVTDLVEKHLWQNVDHELWPVFHLVAPLRQFDVTTLRNLLPHFDSERFGKQGGNFYLLMLNRLIDTALVEWSSERKAYILDDTLRHILALDLEIRQRQRSIDIHARAAELYQRWLTDVPENRSSYLVEWLYHRVKGDELKGQEQSDIAAHAMKDLRDLLERFYHPKGDGDERLFDSASRLVNELDCDDELAGLIGKQARDEMIRSIKEVCHDLA